MRLSYCYPEPDRIREGVRRLAGVDRGGARARRRSAPVRSRTRSPARRRARPVRTSPGPADRRERRPATVRRRARRRAVARARRVGAFRPPGGRRAARRGCRRRRPRRGRRPAAGARARPPAARRRPAAARRDRRGRRMRDVLELLGLPVRRRPARGRAGRRSTSRRPRPSWRRRASAPRRPWPCRTSTFRELGATAVLAALVERLGLPLMVKPARGGSALGASVVRTADDLPGAMVGCFAYGDTALVERFVAGTEVAVSVVETADGPVALPAVEIVPGRRLLRLRRALHRGDDRVLRARPGSTPRLARGCAEAAVAGARGARAARPLPVRPGGRRRRACPGSSRSTWRPA